MSLSEAISSVHPGDPIVDQTASPSFVFVMPGLVPGIHVLNIHHVQRRGCIGTRYEFRPSIFLRKSGKPDLR
jgi:hypothetical protein